MRKYRRMYGPVAEDYYQLVLHGFDEVLERKQRVEPARTPVFDRETEAALFAVAASDPPTGHARCTLRLLAGEVVRLDIVEAVCHETGAPRAKKRTCNPIGR